MPMRGDLSGRARFELLGPLVVRLDGEPVEVGEQTAGSLLVALLLRPGGFADAGALGAAVWGPGGTGMDNLYHHISRLRKTLAPLGVGIGRASGTAGYRLVVPDEAVDARCFDRLTVAATRLRDAEPEQALDRLRAAVGLWRGPVALPELRWPGVRLMAEELDRARLDAEEHLAALELGLGDPVASAGRLRALVAEHPGHPGVTAALIRVLHAAGRSSEAAQVYEHAARVARVAQTPVDVRVERAHRDPTPISTSGGGAGAEGSGPAGWPVPMQLPSAARYFTGRQEELARLLEPPPEGGRAVVVSAVDGMAGIGKTALVVAAGHRLTAAGRYPDGTLFVDLHGYSGQAPTEPAAALDTLLRGLGVPGPQIPPDLDARIGLYRSELARRRVLVVLDNAREEAQVRPLLPGTGGSQVLITSRRRLAGLDEADHLNLDTLPPHEAAWLFRAVVGPGRDPGDQHSVEEIVRVCGLLPLAVRIAAARLRTSRSWTGPDLLTKLRDTHGRLAELDDGERSVKATFTVSYDQLPAEEQHTFAALGLHPGVDYEPYATAALLHTTTGCAGRLLYALDQVNLLAQPTPGRYRFHDLIRAYATTTAHARPEPDQRDALDRLYDHYAHTTTAAATLAYPHDADHLPKPPQPATPTSPLLDQPAAVAWLEAEHTNLLTTARHASSDWSVPGSVDTGISCPSDREHQKWVRHAADLPRSTRSRR